MSGIDHEWYDETRLSFNDVLLVGWHFLRGRVRRTVWWLRRHRVLPRQKRTVYRVPSSVENYRYEVRPVFNSVSDLPPVQTPIRDTMRVSWANPAKGDVVSWEVSIGQYGEYSLSLPLVEEEETL